MKPLKKSEILKNYLFVILFITQSIIAQTLTQKDSLDVIYSLKFKVLENPSIAMNSEVFQTNDSIIKNTDAFEIIELKSEGFKNFIFYKIIYTQIPNALKFEYIMAYQIDKQRFYKLKGFINNDFYYIFKFEARIDSKSPSNLLSKKNKKYFLENHSVEELDLYCLIEHIKDKENWKIPCLSPINKILVDDFGEEHY